jgi:tetratricopeptide (TPR) repeat protein
MRHNRLIFSCLLVAATIFVSANFVLAQGQSRNRTTGNRVLFGDFRIETPPGIEPPTMFQLLLYAGLNVVARQPISPGGRFRFNNLTAGEYVIVLELDGNEVSRNRIRIEANGPLDMQQDIVLVMKAPDKDASTSGVVSVSSLYKRSDENQKKLEEAMAAGKQKKYDQAKELLQQIVVNDPQDFVAWTELGTTFFHLNKLSDAESAYQKALAGYPTFFPALLNLGKLQLTAKNFDGAIETLTKAVESDSKSAEANHLLGEAYLQIKKGSKAVGYLNEALRLDPLGMAEIHLRLATLYNGAGMKDRAATEYEEFLKKKPDYPERAKLEKYIKENKKQ